MKDNKRKCFEIIHELAGFLEGKGHSVTVKHDERGHVYIEKIDSVSSSDYFYAPAYCRYDNYSGVFSLRVRNYTSNGRDMELKSQDGKFDFRKVADRISAYVRVQNEKIQQDVVERGVINERFRAISEIEASLGLACGDKKNGVGYKMSYRAEFKEHFAFEVILSSEDHVSALLGLVKRLQDSPPEKSPTDGAHNVVRLSDRRHL